VNSLSKRLRTCPKTDNNEHTERFTKTGVLFHQILPPSPTHTHTLPKQQHGDEYEHEALAKFYCITATLNLTRTDVQSNPGLYSERPATNRLGHSTAIKWTIRYLSACEPQSAQGCVLGLQNFKKWGYRHTAKKHRNYS
jgi:hypothetical protein